MDPQNVPATSVSGSAGDIRILINEAQAGLAATVNSALTMLYWRIGRRIRTEVPSMDNLAAAFFDAIRQSLRVGIEVHTVEIA
jgi:hypothetical protein